MDDAGRRFLDQIRDSERRAICVGAAGSGGAERPAPPARESQVDAGSAGRAPENARTVYEESDAFPQRVDLG
jgi:hypothetical protein